MRRTISLLALALFLAGPAAAAEEAGRALYRRYCAACHGTAGRGDGPVAPALGEKPTNLTQIAARNKGEFPFVEVAEAIDGTRTVRAHGVSEMPIWGDVFQADPSAPIEQQLVAAGKILAITRYVRTLQQQGLPSH
jgi:mono/diheme cytochrome c family protein